MNDQTHDSSCPCNNADERGCFLISAETHRCISCTCDSAKVEGERDNVVPPA